MRYLFQKKKKYIFLKKRNSCFQKIFHSQKGTILCFFDKNNISNIPRLLFGYNCKTTAMLNIVSSKVIASSSNNLCFNLWESNSGRSIRNTTLIKEIPQKMIACYHFDRIITITIKKLLIHTLNNGSLFYSLSINPILHTVIQIMKDFPQILILSKSDKCFILDYQKGYLVKKIYKNHSIFFPDAIFNRSEKYCLKAPNSINFLGMGKFSQFVYYLTENYNFKKKIVAIKKLIFNILFNYTSFSGILLLNKNKFLWEVNSGLLVYC